MIKKIAFSRKKMTMSGLVPVVQRAFKRVSAVRDLVFKSNTISLHDCLMSALAMFSIKSPSMLDFENGRKKSIITHNLQALFGLKQTPSDTCMRERLDEVDHRQIRGVFKDIFTSVQESKLLQEFQYMDGYYLVSGDGTGYFSSPTIHCDNCCIKKHGNCAIKFITKDIEEMQTIKGNPVYFLVKLSGKPWQLFYRSKEEEVEIIITTIEGLPEILSNKEYKELTKLERAEAKRIVSKYYEVAHPEMAVEYYHQMYCAAIVHPDKKTVLPFPPEPILKGDGSQKNDCERNASKRFYEDLRREHPHLKIIVVEDSLGSNIPHIQMLLDNRMSYIIGAKPGDHKALFDSMKQLIDMESSACQEYTLTTDDGITRRYRYVNNIQLNDSDSEFFVNFLQYTETKPGSDPRVFSWVTDIEITNKNAYLIMRAGRARWKIENETFNTLKNQGYHFEHNFGHGKKHLSSTLASLMILAFTLDQICEAFCVLFKKARDHQGARIRLWKHTGSFFELYFINSWEDFYRALSGEHLGSELIFDTA